MEAVLEAGEELDFEDSELLEVSFELELEDSELLEDSFDLGLADSVPWELEEVLELEASPFLAVFAEDAEE